VVTREKRSLASILADAIRNVAKAEAMYYATDASVIAGVARGRKVTKEVSESIEALDRQRIKARDVLAEVLTRIG
jgi:hypothetical protein